MLSIVGGMYIRDLGILFLGMYRTEIYAYMYGDIYYYSYYYCITVKIKKLNV